MVKVIIGLLLGVSISAGIGYVLLPKVKQAEYDKGVSAGKTSYEVGMAAGITKGRQQAQTEYQREQEVAQAAAQAQAEGQREQAAAKRKTAPKPVQNWHVRGNQLQEPIRGGEQESPIMDSNDTPA